MLLSLQCLHLGSATVESPTNARRERIIHGRMADCALDTNRLQPLAIRFEETRDAHDRIELEQKNGVRWITQVHFAGLDGCSDLLGIAVMSTLSPSSSAFLGLTPGPTPPSFSP